MRGTALRPGDRSFEAAQARMTRSGLGEASRVVRQADALVSMGTVAAGVRAGSVPLGHLDELARVAAAATPEVAAVLRTPRRRSRWWGWPGRVAAGLRPGVGPVGRRAGPGGLQAEHDAQHRERFFTVSVQPNGVFLKGRLDRVAGETLRVALDAMGQYGDDTRSPGQASADALTMLAEARLRRGGPAAAPGGPPPRRRARAGTSGAVSRPHLSLLVAAETIAELLAHQRALHDADMSVSRADIDAAPPSPLRRAGAGRPGLAVRPDRPALGDRGSRDVGGRHPGAHVRAGPRAVRGGHHPDRDVRREPPAGRGTGQAAVHYGATPGRDRAGWAVRLERVRPARIALRGAPHALVGPRHGATRRSATRPCCASTTTPRSTGSTCPSTAWRNPRAGPDGNAPRRTPWSHASAGGGRDLDAHHAPTTGGAPLRYVFRDHRGHPINAPDGHRAAPYTVAVALGCGILPCWWRQGNADRREHEGHGDG